MTAFRTAACAVACLAVACGEPPAKSGSNNGAPNNGGTNNGGTNNGGTNNGGTNNGGTNNGGANNGIEACPDESAADPRPLGFEGVAGAGEGPAVVDAVDASLLTLTSEDGPAQFWMIGGDLTELFEPNDEVWLSATDATDLDGVRVRVHSVAGPAGQGAEIGFASADANDGDLPRLTLSLPLSAATASFGSVVDSATCAVDSDCGAQPRATSVRNIAVDYRQQTVNLAPGEEQLNEEYSFYAARAYTQSFELVESQDCVAEGGATAEMVVTSWGRVFLP